MICISIAEKTLENCILAIADAELSEIRIDLTDLSVDDVKTLFKKHGNKLIATCREGKHENTARLELLQVAINAGAKYVDIEIEADKSYKEELVNCAELNDCKVIISYHNYDETPDKQELDKIVEDCFKDKAYIAKIACMANSTKDAARILSLYDSDKKIVAFAMGELGKVSRVSSLLLGAPFSFAAVSKDKQTASGQLDKLSIVKIIEQIKNA